MFDSDHLIVPLHFRNAGNGITAALTNGEATDDFNESGMADTKINRSNSKTVAGGRDTSRKGRGDGDKKNDKDSGKDNLTLVIKLESDVKRLKCDLQLSRNRENELRDQIVSYMSSEYRQHRTLFYFILLSWDDLLVLVMTFVICFIYLLISISG